MSERVVIRAYNQHHHCVTDKRLKFEEDQAIRDKAENKGKLTKKESDARQAKLKEQFQDEQDILEGYTEPFSISLGRVR